MTREEVMELLDKLELSSYMNEYNVDNRIEELGYRNLVRVCGGATKICLVFQDDTDFIVKWSYDCDDDNSESIKECHIYTCAVDAGLGFLFPKTEIMGKWGDVTVIIQDKIDYSVEDCSYDKRQYYRKIARTVTNRIFCKMEKGFRIGGCYDRDLDTTWGKLVISLYGKQITKKLCKFIKEYKINDLHGANIGYKNDKPIILDFSGYYR